MPRLAEPLLPVNKPLPFDAGLSVAELLPSRPQTIAVFTRHRMACVGCPIAAFETVAEVAAIYKLNLACFLTELEQASTQS